MWWVSAVGVGYEAQIVRLSVSSGEIAWLFKKNFSNFEICRSRSQWILQSRRPDFEVRGLLSTLYKEALDDSIKGCFVFIIYAECTFNFRQINIQYGVYFFLIEGQTSIGENTLPKRDGLGITDENEIEITARNQSKLLSVEVPMT